MIYDLDERPGAVDIQIDSASASDNRIQGVFFLIFSSDLNK